MKTIVKLSFCFALLLSISVYAEVVTDGSVGGKISLSGKMVIPQDLGTTAGSNLFHSFKTFNINTGERATFTGDAALQNVISRVTGGNVSNIDGLLKSEIGNANFYFINPAGVTFGAKASVNVPAAFYVSTANALQFADGSQFNASLLSPSNFSTAEPITFGFLNNQGGDIKIQDSSLPFYNANTVSLSAHNVVINDGWLINPSGNIQIYATGDTVTELPLNTPVTTALTGRIELNTGGYWGSVLDVTGNSGGNIKLQGGDISISGSQIGSNTSGSGNAGTVNITGNNVSILNGSWVASETGGTGKAGNVEINASKVLVDGTSKITTDTYDTGAAGTVNIKGGSLTVSNGGKISSDTYAKGNAGSITLNSNNAVINKGLISSSALSGSTGNAGTITVKGGNISLSNNSTLSSWNSGNINAGLKTGIDIAANSLSLDNSTIETKAFSSGNASNIKVSVENGDLSLANGSVIGSNTYGSGNTGTVDVAVKNGLLSIANGSKISALSQLGNGNASDVKVTADNIVIDGQYNSTAFTGIYSKSSPSATGNAGNVSVTGNQLTIKNEGQISSDTYSSGRAGTVSVTANDILLDSAGKIASEPIKGSSSAGGDVNVIATNQLTLRQGGKISSSTFSSGNAGNVAISVKNLTIEDAVITTPKGKKAIAGIYSTAEAGTGNAGNIRIDAKTGQLALNGGGVISSSTWTVGNAGSINIDAGQLSIDGQGKNVPTGIFSIAETGSSGKAGNLTLNVNNDVSLVGGGSISSSTKGQGNAGNLNIYAGGNITVDSSNAFTNAQGSRVTNITSSAKEGSTGNAGNVLINAPNGRLLIANAGKIQSSSEGTGNAGNVSVQAKQIQIEGANTDLETGIVTDSFLPSSFAKAGVISLSADEITLNGGTIRSNTFTKGDAGQIVVDVKNGLLSLVNGSGIKTNTYAEGNAGNVTVAAKKIFIDRQDSLYTTGIMSDAQQQSTTGNAGNVSVTSDELTIQNGGQISSGTFAEGNAGAVNVNAGQILIDRKNNALFTGISSDANSGSSGNAGSITVDTKGGNLTLRNQGKISSSAKSKGSAGNITLNSGQITIDGANNTGVFAAATETSWGQTGSILINTDYLTVMNKGVISIQTEPTVTAAQLALLTPTSLNINAQSLKLLSGGQVSAVTFGDVNAGIINLNIGSDLTAQEGAVISSATLGAGNAGSISVTAPRITLDNASIAATAKLGSSGIAGSVTVDATQALAAFNNASINSSTYGKGKAGDVTVQTPLLSLDSGAEISALAGVGSQGETGEIHVIANTANLSNSGKISVQNDGIASNPLIIKPSDLVLDIPNLVLNGGIITAATSGNVNAGNVIVKTQNPLAMSSGASINSNTSGSGSAGNVSVTAPMITLDNSNISAEASASSQGQTGNVTVTASQSIYLTNHANISLKNDANIANPRTIIPTSVTVSAPDIDLKDSAITTESTGNVDASHININFSHWLTLDPSFITTTANTGNGGAININGGQLIYLENSGFLTSVSGANSNGGNINVTADYLVMNTGVIQANAVGGSGGDINLNLKALIPSQNQLILGGRKVLWQPFKSGFNVIQAASENGVSGAINVTSPQFDISASVSGLDSSQLVMPNIDNNPCQNSAMLDSSLSRAGQGGIPDDESQYGFIPPALISSAIVTPSFSAY